MLGLGNRSSSVVRCDFDRDCSEECITTIPSALGWGHQCGRLHNCFILVACLWLDGHDGLPHQGDYALFASGCTVLGFGVLCRMWYASSSTRTTALAYVAPLTHSVGLRGDGNGLPPGLRDTACILVFPACSAFVERG